jgi:hypothetical protein
MPAHGVFIPAPREITSCVLFSKEGGLFGQKCKTPSTRLTDEGRRRGCVGDGVQFHRHANSCRA